MRGNYKNGVLPFWGIADENQRSANDLSLCDFVPLSLNEWGAREKGCRRLGNKEARGAVGLSGKNHWGRRPRNLRLLAGTFEE
jgi:hypothetical protein